MVHYNNKNKKYPENLKNAKSIFTSTMQTMDNGIDLGFKFRR